MKNKTKILIAAFLLVLFVYPSTIQAEPAPNYFRPNVVIPGMDKFFPNNYRHTGTYEVTSTTSSTAKTTIEFDEYLIDSSGIIRYVQAVYSYSAILAGVIAMFMLVFAGYQWMLAAGNAEKIGKARDTISGVLLGLTLLFGGYLLLSQVSTRLVVLNPIDLPDIIGMDGAPPVSDQCTEKNTTEPTCTNALGCIWVDGICKTDPDATVSCSLTREEVEATSIGIICCDHNYGQPDQGYVYAKTIFNQNYCDELCDTGAEGETWTNVTRSRCVNALGY